MGLKLEVTLCDENLAALVDAIAERVAAKVGSTPVAKAEDDGFDDTPVVEEKITREQMQDTIRDAVKKHGKDKVKVVVKKIAGVEKAGEIAEDKFKTLTEAFGKMK